MPEGQLVQLIVVEDSTDATELAELGLAELGVALGEAEQDIAEGRVVDEAEVWSRLKAIA